MQEVEGVALELDDVEKFRGYMLESVTSALADDEERRQRTMMKQALRQSLRDVYFAHCVSDTRGIQYGPINLYDPSATAFLLKYSSQNPEKVFRNMDSLDCRKYGIELLLSTV